MFHDIPDNPLFEDFCSKCGTVFFNTTLEPEGSTHYARISCAGCGKFHKWQPKPKPEICISKLLRREDLEPWQRKFLKAVAYRKATQAEAIVLQAIEEKTPACSGAGR